MGTPIHVDPFCTIPWQSDEAREVLIGVRRDNTVHTEYVWTTVRQLRSGDVTLALVHSGLDAEGGTSANAIWSASPEECPPTYRRNERRRSQGPRLHTLEATPEGHVQTEEFDNQLDQALLLVDYIQTRTCIFELIDELKIMTEKLTDIALGLEQSSMHGTH